MVKRSTRVSLAGNAACKSRELEATERATSPHWHLRLRSLDAHGLLPTVLLVAFDRAAVALQLHAHFGGGVLYHVLKLLLLVARA